MGFKIAALHRPVYKVSFHFISDGGKRGGGLTRYKKSPISCAAFMSMQEIELCALSVESFHLNNFKHRNPTQQATQKIRHAPSCVSDQTF